MSVSTLETQGPDIRFSEPNTRVSRNHQFDLLRILFAVLVLLSHAPELTDGNRSRELLSRIAGPEMSFGIFAVDGFFLLSGFLIIQSWEHDPDLLNFLRKRILRIIPGYLVAALLSIAVVGWFAPAVANFFRHLDRQTLKSVLLLYSPLTPDVFPGVPIHLVNGSLWTIFYEFRCYLLVPFLGLCGLLRKRSLYGSLTLVLLAIAGSDRLTDLFSWKSRALQLGDPSATYHFASAFLVGGCFFLFRDRVRFTPLGAVLASVLLAVITPFAPHLLGTALLLCGGYLLFYFGSRRLSSLKWMERVPDISYGIYLYGWPVEAFLIWSHRGSPWIAFAASLSICVCLGWLSWSFIERPALTLRRSRSRRQS